MSDDEQQPSLAELAARVLRSAEHTGSSSDAHAKEKREEHLALIAATLREEGVRATRRRWSTAALAVAAVLVAAVGLRTILKDAEPARNVPAPVAVAPVPAAASYDVHVESTGAAVHAGDHVTATAGGAALVVATGSKITLNQGADVSVVEEGRTQTFALAAGAMRADVAKLHEGERFLVRTSDTEVEVRGTSFRVERVDVAPACRADLHTRVIVSEGVVVVRHAGAEDRVRAGEEWPPPCPSPAAEPAGTASGAPSITAPAAPSSSASKLAVANELFAKAESARKAGDHRGAVVLFDRLLREHPSSPNVEAATVERMRELDQFDRGRAVSAARDYLARFPRGFARAEAEAIIALSP